MREIPKRLFDQRVGKYRQPNVDLVTREVRYLENDARTVTAVIVQDRTDGDYNWAAFVRRRFGKWKPFDVGFQFQETADLAQASLRARLEADVGATHDRINYKHSQSRLLEERFKTGPCEFCGWGAGEHELDIYVTSSGDPVPILLCVKTKEARPLG